jgi:hypothetical protein
VGPSLLPLLAHLIFFSHFLSLLRKLFCFSLSLALGHYRIANHSVQQTYHLHIKTHSHHDPNINPWHQQYKPRKKKKKINRSTHFNQNPLTSSKPDCNTSNPASTSPERAHAVTIPAPIATHMSPKTSLSQPLAQPTSTSTMATPKII